MRVLHTVPSLHADYGGPSRSVPALARALISVAGAEVVIRAMDGSQSEDGRVRRLTRNEPLSKLLQETPRFDLIHDHGVWRSCHLQIAWFASRFRVPRVVSPRGMLEPWALRHKGWKKRAAWIFYQRRMLNSSALLHATSNEEAENLRELGLTPRIGIVPNGTDLPVLPASTTPAHANTDAGLPSPRTLLFLSRIHPKKGLELLLDAWSALRPQAWRIRIAGPGEESYIQSLKERCQRLGIDQQVEWVGPASDPAKDALFRSTDLFVLPSYSENFGLVVAEALSYGIPVITTTGCPWAELRTERAGWWVEPAATALQQALHEATSLPVGALRELGGRGRRLVERNYGWDSVGARMHAAYLGILQSS